MQQDGSKDTFDVLLVEDNPAEVRLTEEALRECAILCQLHVSPDGEHALNYLRGVGMQDEPARPDLILLDWNLPKMNGEEVLRAVKADEKLRNIPVVVLTNSRAQSDVLSAYSLHANCFITKPSSLSGFFAVISEIERFWRETVALPPK